MHAQCSYIANWKEGSVEGEIWKEGGVEREMYEGVKCGGRDMEGGRC